MNRYDKILAVDDEKNILAIYGEMLGLDGLSVTGVSSYQQAVDALDQGDWSVVLLDQRLHGSAGGDEGLELIEEVERRSPGAKIIIVTGYASPETIERAFKVGVYDYVEKTENFKTLLRAKVRNAIELARERWLTSAEDEVSTRLSELQAQVRGATTSAEKGRILEDLVESIFRAAPGFVVATRRRGLDEEFDLVVRNESIDPFWTKESQYFLVECKNWSGSVGPNELDRFTNKLERRFGRATLGFFIAANGFTKGFAATLATRRRENIVVVPIGPDELQRLVDDPARNEVLKTLHQRAIETSAGAK
ncbi:response regulator [Nannocystaceae bacterium ST9]